MIEENSRILVQGLGYVPIKDVSVDEMLEVWDGYDYNLGQNSVGKNKLCTIEFYGGNTLKCTPEHLLMGRITPQPFGWVRAMDVDETYQIMTSGNTPTFDFFPKEEFPLLGKLNSFALGILIGLYFKFGQETECGITLMLPEQDFELVRYIKIMFKGLSLPFEEDCLYRASGNRVKLYIENFILLQELKSLDIRKGFTEQLWTSKAVIKGILTVLFEYCSKAKENFELRFGN